MIKTLENSTETSVVSQKDFDRSNFAEIVSKYQHLVTSIAYSLTGDFQRSEDIAQKTFLVAWEKGYRTDEPFLKAWLRTTAQNLAKNDNRLMANRLVSLESVSGKEPSEETSPDLETRRKLLWQSIQHIPEKYRQVMVLYYQQEHSVKQVADFLGLTEATTKQRLSRGRKLLKQEVEKWIDDTLQENEPNPTFVAGVLALIPTGGVVAKTVAKSGVTYAISSTFGKFLPWLFTGGMLGFLGGLAGAGIGLLGAKLGVNNSLKHATSEEEKELIRGFFWRIQILTIALLAIQLGTTFLLSASVTKPYILAGTILVYTFWLVRGIFRFNRDQNALHKKYGKPAWVVEHNKSQATTRVGFATSVSGFTVGVWGWLLVMTIISGNWHWLTANAITLVGLVAIGCTLAMKSFQKNDQTRFYGRWILANAWLQFPLVIGLWMSSPGIEEKVNDGLQSIGSNPSSVTAWPLLVTGSLMFLGLNLVGFLTLRWSKKSSVQKDTQETS